MKGFNPKNSLFTEKDFLVICCYCKKIKDKQEWISTEKKSLHNFHGLFSHGICPGCMSKYYRNLLECENEI